MNVFSSKNAIDCSCSTVTEQSLAFFRQRCTSDGVEQLRFLKRYEKQEIIRLIVFKNLSGINV